MKILWGLSGGKCAFKDCGKSFFARVDGKLRHEAYMGHIYGLNAGSARFDPTKTPEELNSADNLMLLCVVHHKEVDDKSLASKYPAEELKEWKRVHEEAVARGACVPPSFEPVLDVWADGPGSIGRILRECAEEEITSYGPGPVQRVVATDGAVGEIVEAGAKKLLRRESTCKGPTPRVGQLHLQGDTKSTGMVIAGEVAVLGTKEDPSSVSFGGGGSLGFAKGGRFVFKTPRELRGQCPACSAVLVVGAPVPPTVRCEKCGRDWRITVDEAASEDRE